MTLILNAIEKNEQNFGGWIILYKKKVCLKFYSMRDKAISIQKKDYF
jgi:hypothetical protein